MNILSVDLGGTRLRAALYDDALNRLTREETWTHADAGTEAVLQRVIAIAQAALPPGVRPDVVGISAPGPLNPHTGVILHTFALPGWEQVALGQQLGDALNGVPVYLENDANCAAFAEYATGAGAQADPMLYMTLSTGIGGGVVINGQLFTGWSGLAMEPGHMQLMDRQGVVRRLEELASGTGIARMAREQLSASSARTPLRLLATLDGAAVGAAAQAGDPFALDIVQQAGYYLGLGLVNLLHLISPQVVVLGGSVTRLGELLLAPARQIVAERILNAAFIPPDWLRIAQHGEDVCLLGAAINARQRHLTNPMYR